ncbi:MAG: hypothetical protein UT29_C0001G0124 [Candidatus Yanofskybacteria bacterium GW2011_GWA1_39_13]|uniref:Uncharacterized protein n=1 Tax=Yanofskybacteria sp. (strain GW2011_GWA1_39_13) TaxID=1619019 RepID=A0A0G0MF34_YANXG|nr:MAG: hypothetical protein UT29_C0001G0124 [Candidatus Yanofskybacteria bacterium GW2011_GWA1_39_13]
MGQQLLDDVADLSDAPANSIDADEASVAGNISIFPHLSTCPDVVLTLLVSPGDTIEVDVVKALGGPDVDNGAVVLGLSSSELCLERPNLAVLADPVRYTWTDNEQADHYPTKLRHTASCALSARTEFLQNESYLNYTTF